MDLDHFKDINDTHGHETGNVVLKEISEILTNNTRKADVLFRYGGEELCVMLTNTSNEGALSYSEKMRGLIEGNLFTRRKNIRMTSSFGIATFPKDSVYTTDELINAADKALYQAKHAGRNRVVPYQSNLNTDQQK